MLIQLFYRGLNSSILFTFLFVLGPSILTISACSEAPQCVPGRTVACPCVPTGQGIQRCAEDGSRYLECECGHLPSPIKSFTELGKTVNAGPVRDKAQVNIKPKGSAEEKTRRVSAEPSVILNQAIPSAFSARGTAEAATLNTEPSSPPSRSEALKVIRKANKSTQVIPLEAEIAEVSDKEIVTRAETSASKMFKLNLRKQQKEWWFYSETLERCVLADNVNGIDYAPLKLLSEGCYRLSGEELMVIRCDDPPLGPKTYRFTEQKRDCIQAKSEEQSQRQAKRAKASENNNSVTIAALDPVIEARVDQPDTSSNLKQSVRDDERSWYCMCYEEMVKGAPTLSTACRPSKEMCQDLSDKVREGSKILVKDSLMAGCQERRGSSPWRLFTGKGSRRYFWQPSSHPGAWWSAEGCFLPMSKAKLKALQAKRSKEGSKSTRTVASKPAEDSPPPELFEPIGSKRSLIRFGEKGSAPRADRCREACRANLITSKERRAEYGMSDVPPLLKWGKTFSDRVKLVKTICMSNQGKAKRGRERCLKKVINKCSIYCERAED